MSKSSAYASNALVVKSHYSEVVEWQLYRAGALLKSYSSCYRTVNLVSEPVFTGDGLYLENLVEIMLEFIVLVRQFTELVINVLVCQHSLWCAAEEVG